MKVLGFEVIVQSDYGLFWTAKTSEWAKGNYIDSRVEFGSSPIRDKNALNRYCDMLTGNGLSFTVHPICKGN
jgi:hypothetical protein